MEIERKFLINAIPFSLDAYNRKAIEQGYISTTPVIRIRKSNDKYILTIKGKGLMAREEHELFIEPSEYEHLLTKLDFPLIKKTRYLIPYSGFTIELDVFHEHLNGLVLAEVEFGSLNDANTFEAPEWFERDVTGDARYQNSRLCQLNSLKEL